MSESIIGMVIAMLVLSCISLVILLVMGISKKIHQHHKAVLICATIHLLGVFTYWVLTLFLLFNLV